MSEWLGPPGALIIPTTKSWPSGNGPRRKNLRRAPNILRKIRTRYRPSPSSPESIGNQLPAPTPKFLAPSNSLHRRGPRPNNLGSRYTPRLGKSAARIPATPAVESPQKCQYSLVRSRALAAPTSAPASPSRLPTNELHWLNAFFLPSARSSFLIFWSCGRSELHGPSDDFRPTILPCVCHCSHAVM